MNKKKILFIIGSYPSEMSANVLCDEKIIQELVKCGNYEIHVLALRFNKQPLEEEISDVKVHRFSNGLFWDIYTKARHSKTSWKTKIIFALDRFFLRFKQMVVLPIYPLYQPLETLSFFIHAKKLHKKIHFDLVIAEHNGLDTVLGGYLLKKEFPEIKFMPIFWDPLSGAIAPKYLPQKFSYKRRVKTEEKILKYSDSFVAMKSHGILLEKLYKGSSSFGKIKLLDLPSLQNPDTIKNAQKKYNFSSENIYFCFAGTLANRNLEFLANLLEKTGLKNIVLLVISGINNQIYVENLNKKYKVHIDFLPYMPQKELMAVLDKAHFLVNFGVNSNIMVASKIFEYMSFGKPLIATYLRDDDANLPYLKKYPLSFLLDERETDTEKQAQALRNFIEQNVNKHIDYKNIAPLFYANTPQAYAEEIAKILGDK